MRRFLMAVLLTAAAAELALCAGLYWAMLQPPDAFGRIVAHLPMPLMATLPFETLWTRARAGGIHMGDLAPDFRLSALDRKSTVRLSSFRGDRPVVLIFGSYT